MRQPMVTSNTSGDASADIGRAGVEAGLLATWSLDIKTIRRPTNFDASQNVEHTNHDCHKAPCAQKVPESWQEDT